jgi:hypothetical protein
VGGVAGPGRAGEQALPLGQQESADGIDLGRWPRRPPGGRQLLQQDGAAEREPVVGRQVQGAWRHPPQVVAVAPRGAGLGHEPGDHVGGQFGHRRGEQGEVGVGDAMAAVGHGRTVRHVGEGAVERGRGRVDGGRIDREARGRRGWRCGVGRCGGGERRHDRGGGRGGRGVGAIRPAVGAGADGGGVGWGPWSRRSSNVGRWVAVGWQPRPALGLRGAPGA